MAHDAWGWATGTGAMALVSYLITPSEFPPRYGLDHEFAVDDDEFLPTMTGATGVPFLPGNRDRHPEQRRSVLSGDARRHRAGRALDHRSRRTSTGPGTSAASSREALAAKASAGLRVEDPARRCWLDARSGKKSSGLWKAAGASWPGTTRSGIQHRPLQPSHAPQVADPRRTHRLHRRRRHCGPLARQRRGPGEWRDMQIRIEGPAVMPLQTGFAHNWLQTTGELISGPLFYPCRRRPDRSPRRRS